MKTLIMKLAVLVFLSLDARAGVIPQPEMRPYDEVLQDFKSRVGGNVLPADIAEAGLNQMEIWTQSGGKVKSHRFDLNLVNHGEPIASIPMDLDNEQFLEAMRGAQAEIDRLNAALADLPALVEKNAEAAAEIERLNALLAGKTSNLVEGQSEPLPNGEIDPASAAAGNETILPYPGGIDPATLKSYAIHPAGVSPSTVENDSSKDTDATSKESDPPSKTEVASTPAPKKRGGSAASSA
jgi:hypothetical protein